MRNAYNVDLKPIHSSLYYYKIRYERIINSQRFIEIFLQELENITAKQTNLETITLFLSAINIF